MEPQGQGVFRPQMSTVTRRKKLDLEVDLQGVEILDLPLGGAAAAEGGPGWISWGAPKRESGSTPAPHPPPQEQARCHMPWTRASDGCVCQESV